MLLRLVNSLYLEVCHNGLEYIHTAIGLDERRSSYHESRLECNNQNSEDDSDDNESSVDCL